MRLVLPWMGAVKVSRIAVGFHAHPRHAAAWRQDIQDGLFADNPWFGVFACVPLDRDYRCGCVRFDRNFGFFISFEVGLFTYREAWRTGQGRDECHIASRLARLKLDGISGHPLVLLDKLVLVEIPVSINIGRKAFLHRFGLNVEELDVHRFGSLCKFLLRVPKKLDFALSALAAPYSQQYRRHGDVLRRPARDRLRVRPGDIDLPNDTAMRAITGILERCIAPQRGLAGPIESGFAGDFR